jgi:hypothetical protein
MSFSDALFGVPAQVEPWILDRSTLEDFATCPFMAQCRKTGKHVVGDLAQVGTEIHRLIHEAFEWCKGEPESAPADYFQQEAPKCRPDIQPDVLRAARAVSYEIGKINMGRILGVEYQVDFQLPGKVKDRPIKITTAIDLLLQGAADTLLTVFDWKTGYKKRTNSDAADSFQAQFIAYILFQLYPTVQTVHFWFIETRYGTRAYARFDRKELAGFSALTQEQAIEARIMQAVGLWAIDSQEAWPEPCKCAWCDFTADCPHVVGDPKELAKDEKGFVDQYIALDARLESMKKAATEWIKSGKATVLKGTKVSIEKTRPNNRFTLSVYGSKTKKEDDE